MCAMQTTINSSGPGLAAHVEPVTHKLPDKLDASHVTRLLKETSKPKANFPEKLFDSVEVRWGQQNNKKQIHCGVACCLLQRKIF